MVSTQKQWGCTEVKGDRIEYEWTIKNFKLLLEDAKEALYSPVFHTNDMEQTWQISFYPRGNGESKSDEIAIYLCLVSSQTLGIKVQCELSVLKLNNVIESDTFIYKYDSLTGYGFKNFVNRSKLVNSYSRDDTIIIRCKIDIPVKPYIKSSSESTAVMDEPISFISVEGQLVEDFNLLFREPKNPDVTIIVGDEKFSAHRLILATRSSVFLAMFEQKEMNENVKNEVKIENMEPAVVKAMLEFMYTDKVTDLESLANGLLAAADKYDLQHLTGLCEQTLYKTLDKDNAAETLILADLHHANKLKNGVMKFIENHLYDVVESEGYKKMQMYPELLADLIRALALQKKPKHDE